jgi:hypothetical protein
MNTREKSYIAGQRTDLIKTTAVNTNVLLEEVVTDDLL